MQTDAVPQQVQEVLASLPTMAALVLAGLAVVGFVLWLLGRSIARAACVIGGLVFGGLAGYVVGQLLRDEGAYTLPLVLGLAIAGALVAGLMFRVWMGISTAVVLALAVPAATIVWQGTPIDVTVGTPEADAATTDVERAEPAGDEAAVEEGVTIPGLSIQLPTWDEAKQTVTPDEPEEKPRARQRDQDGEATSTREQVDPLAAVGRVAGLIYERQSTAIAAWWAELSQPARWLLIAGAVAGAGVGLLLGLIAPYGAASVQTALVGAILLFFPLRGLAESYLPGMTGVLPTTPRATVVTLGLITLLGVLVQWALFRKRADR